MSHGREFLYSQPAEPITSCRIKVLQSVLNHQIRKGSRKYFLSQVLSLVRIWTATAGIRVPLPAQVPAGQDTHKSYASSTEVTSPQVNQRYWSTSVSFPSHTVSHSRHLYSQQSKQTKSSLTVDDSIYCAVPLPRIFSGGYCDDLPMGLHCNPDIRLWGTQGKRCGASQRGRASHLQRFSILFRMILEQNL